MRVPSGSTDRYVYFVAVDATDFSTRETGLTTFTVYMSRNGGVAAAMTTPTINETDTTNMPGVYELLLDEDTTIAAGNDSEEMAIHITHAGMSPVTRTIELYRPKITLGNTLDVTATGAAGIDWANVEGSGTAVDLSATSINLCDTITTYTGNTAQTGDAFARLGAPAGVSVSADIADVPTVAEFNARTLLAASYFDPANDTVANVTTVGTCTTNTDMRGTDSALLAASAPANFGDLSITLTTGLVNVSDKTGFSLAADQSGVTIGTVNTMAGTIGTLDALDTAQDTQHATTQAAVAAVPTVEEIQTTQMTESYAADGIAPSIAQALMLIQQMLTDFGISGTTLTTKQLDGTTTAATFTLAGDPPTGITRAT